MRVLLLVSVKWGFMWPKVPMPRNSTFRRNKDSAGHGVIAEARQPLYPAGRRPQRVCLL